MKTSTPAKEVSFLILMIFFTLKVWQFFWKRDRRAYKNELPSDISGTDSKLEIKLYTKT